MPSGEIIVLANSRKQGGRCVAGVSVETGEWLRPVSRRPHGQLMPSDSRVAGRDVRLLDIVRFDYVERCGDPAQPENVLIADTDWTLVDSLAPAEAYEWLEPHLALGPDLLGNRGKAVREDMAAEGMDASLALVESEGSLWFVREEPGEGESRRRSRVCFRLGGKNYELSPTDFEIGPSMARLDCGRYSPADLELPGEARALVTVSLAEARNGWHTKLAAAVLFLPR